VFYCLLQGLASAVPLGSESCETQDNVLLSHLYPRALGSLSVASYDFAGTAVEVF
jgi:hypothetical protein